MAKIVEDNMDIQNLDAETCRVIYKGKVLPGNRCRVRIRLNDRDPKHATIIPIEDDTVRTDKEV